MKKPDWNGIFPAVTTKFLPELELDREATAEHIRKMIDAGVHGIIVVGTLGENNSLSAEEKREVVRLAMEVCRGRVPLLAGVAEATTDAGCRFAEDAAKLGADGLLVLPPMEYKEDAHEAETHFRTVASASNLPIMIYNNPGFYGLDVTPEMFANLADEPKFVALKESTGDVRRITDIFNAVGDRYRVFIGVDDLALEAFAAGADGWVAGLVCAFPRETMALYDLMKAGRLEEARALYRWFIPLLHLDASPKLVQYIKLAEAMTGMGTEYVRPPRLRLSGDERTEVSRIIKEALTSRPSLERALR